MDIIRYDGERSSKKKELVNAMICRQKNNRFEPAKNGLQKIYLS